MWGFCISALHMIADYEGGLNFIEEIRESRPDVWQDAWQNRETYALIALRRLEEAEQLIEERLSSLDYDESPFGVLNTTALEYDAHGYPDAARALWERALRWLESQAPAELETLENRRERAELLLYLGNYEEALGLLIGLTEENRDNLSDLGRLGIAYARLGDRSNAERLSNSVVPMAQPFRRGYPDAWRAAIAAHLGDLVEAVTLLDQAIEKGWSVSLKPHRNQEFKPLRGFEPFERLVEPRG